LLEVSWCGFGRQWEQAPAAQRDGAECYGWGAFLDLEEWGFAAWDAFVEFLAGAFAVAGDCFSAEFAGAGEVAVRVLAGLSFCFPTLRCPKYGAPIFVLNDMGKQILCCAQDDIVKTRRIGL
jgi:hypothetical protein